MLMMLIYRYSAVTVKHKIRLDDQTADATLRPYLSGGRIVDADESEMR